MSGTKYENGHCLAKTVALAVEAKLLQAKLYYVRIVA